MEVIGYRRCTICSVPSSSSVELVREIFSASRTLEKTVELLWGRIRSSEVDTKNIFKEMTEEKEGALFCFPCLAVLHAGMGIISEIMKLEERLKNLIGKITVEETFLTQGNACQDQQTKNGFPNDDIKSRTKNSSGQSSIGDSREVISNEGLARGVDFKKTKETEDEESQKTCDGLKKSKKKRLRKKIESSEDDECEPSNSSESTKKKKSRDSAALKRKYTRRDVKFTRIAGVQECPSCNYKVDVRTPDQAAQSTESLSKSVRDMLVEKSRYKLAFHFRDVHLGVSGMRKFTQLTNIGGKQMKSYKCIACPFVSTNRQSYRVVQHYISLHMCKRPIPSSLSCPEEGCSFAAVAVKSGVDSRGTRFMRETLSTHVIRCHDRRSLQSSLIVTEGKRKAYKCTRCDHTNPLPEEVTNLLRVNTRILFLRHFFDVHLRNSIPKLSST